MVQEWFLESVASDKEMYRMLCKIDSWSVKI